jgi:hypothetical protein
MLRADTRSGTCYRMRRLMCESAAHT